MEWIWVLATLLELLLHNGEVWFSVDRFTETLKRRNNDVEFLRMLILVCMIVSLLSNVYVFPVHWRAHMPMHAGMHYAKGRIQFHV